MKMSSLKKKVLIPAVAGILALGFYSYDAFTQQSIIAPEGEKCAWDLQEDCTRPAAKLNCTGCN
ncbi:hypothetical protein [Marivirga arenosa]|uniref:Uncharacterized protein n=1 Tax=Marivirga arenosa TaxID=3059076 RepID=A0AA51ZXI3_9BACT|nr:hypothetical protein [Marivirga sp. BKB1-2]WNB18537.1 hypothetical protein QYS47_30530 [Marivirga sp. BKB1-2]